MDRAEGGWRCEDDDAARRDHIGARADLENVPIDRLQAFYKKYYQPDNAVLVVAGPRSRDLLKKITDADLSNEAFPWLTGQKISIGVRRPRSFSSVGRKLFPAMIW